MRPASVHHAASRFARRTGGEPQTSLINALVRQPTAINAVILMCSFSVRWVGQSASESEDPPHAHVSEVDVVAVHHRARTSDHADIVLTAILDCLRRDARSLPQGLMHPDAADPCIAAVVHDTLRGFRSSDDHDPVDATRD
jgi:hypothetical protein